MNGVIITPQIWRVYNNVWHYKHSVNGATSGVIYLDQNNSFEFSTEIPPADSYNPNGWNLDIYRDDANELKLQSSNFAYPRPRPIDGTYNIKTK